MSSCSSQSSFKDQIGQAVPETSPRNPSHISKIATSDVTPSISQDLPGVPQNLAMISAALQPMSATSQSTAASQETQSSQSTAVPLPSVQPAVQRNSAPVSQPAVAVQQKASWKDELSHQAKQKATTPVPTAAALPSSSAAIPAGCGEPNSDPMNAQERKYVPLSFVKAFSKSDQTPVVVSTPGTADVPLSFAKAVSTSDPTPAVVSRPGPRGYEPSTPPGPAEKQQLKKPPVLQPSHSAATKSQTTAHGSGKLLVLPSLHVLIEVLKNFLSK